MFAEILGWDIVIVLAIIALLFGGAKLPKLARSLGSAKGEFEKGLREGAPEDKKSDKAEKDSGSEKSEA
jgi:sec-independent protein translocase protein TatA